MKNIDEIYKDWSGKSHIENSCKDVHDSAEAQDFAKYYHNEMKQSENVVLDGVVQQSELFTCKLDGGKENCNFKGKHYMACVTIRKCPFASI